MLRRNTILFNSKLRLRPISKIEIYFVTNANSVTIYFRMVYNKLHSKPRLTEVLGPVKRQLRLPQTIEVLP